MIWTLWMNSTMTAGAYRISYVPGKRPRRVEVFYKTTPLGRFDKTIEAKFMARLYQRLLSTKAVVAVADIRKMAAATGLDKLTPDEVDAEIAAARQSRNA